MNKNYILGGLLFLSLAANIFLVSTMAGKELPFGRGERMRAAMVQIRALPDPQREDAITVVKKYRPQVRAQLQELKQYRKDTFAYLAQKDYDHAKAEERFKIIRDKTAAVQQAIQTMVLELADKLTPEQRAKILHIETAEPESAPAE